MHEMPPQLLLLEKRIKWTVAQNVGAAVLFLLAGALVVTAGAHTLWAGNWKGLLLLGIGLLMVWVGRGIGQDADAGWPARESRLFKALSVDARDVCWAHCTEGGYSALKVYFVDGTSFHLSANQRDSQTLLAWVAERAPHALLGFGPEEQAAYAERVRQAQSTTQVA